TAYPTRRSSDLELRTPFHSGPVAHQEPSLLVLQPQPTSMVVLPGCWSIKVVDSGGDLVHLLARRDVLRRISPSRVVGNKDPPRIVLGLRMQANGHVDLSVTVRPGRGRRAS